MSLTSAKLTQQQLKAQQDLDNSTYLLKLYGRDNDHYSHRIRLALQIKNLTIMSYFVDNVRDLPQDVKESQSINAVDSLPIMLERDFVITQPDIIIQYIDERFPTPQLMPSMPQDRVRMRAMVRYLDNGIIGLADAVMDEKNRRKTSLSKNLRDELITFSYEYFGDINPKEHEMNLIDCMLAPLLWRLDALGVKIENRRALKYQPLLSYMNYLFSQEVFIRSCTERELQLYADSH